MRFSGCFSLTKQRQSNLSSFLFPWDTLIGRMIYQFLQASLGVKADHIRIVVISSIYVWITWRAGLTYRFSGRPTRVGLAFQPQHLHLTALRRHASRGHWAEASRGSPGGQFSGHDELPHAKRGRARTHDALAKPGR